MVLYAVIQFWISWIWMICANQSYEISLYFTCGSMQHKCVRLGFQKMFRLAIEISLAILARARQPWSTEVWLGGRLRPCPGRQLEAVLILLRNIHFMGSWLQSSHRITSLSHQWTWWRQHSYLAAKMATIRMACLLTEWRGSGSDGCLRERRTRHLQDHRWTRFSSKKMRLAILNITIAPYGQALKLH